MARPHSAFTVTYKGLASVLFLEVWVGKASDDGNHVTEPLHKFKAVWDTGAEGTAISDNVVKTCGLAPWGRARMQGINQEVEGDSYLVCMRLPQEVTFPCLHVAQPGNLQGVDVLIGMDVIARGDFAISNHQGRTVLTYRTPSVGAVDFVQQTRTAQGIRSKGVVPRNAPCPCGSGKKYKNCCLRK